jgi:hypothetical protein
MSLNFTLQSEKDVTERSPEVVYPGATIREPRFEKHVTPEARDGFLPAIRDLRKMSQAGLGFRRKCVQVERAGPHKGLFTGLKALRLTSLKLIRWSY